MNTLHLSRLQGIFREVLDQPGLILNPELSPATMPEWDSVAMVQLVLACEQEFGVRFSTEDVASIRSVADFLRIIGRER